jgi:hypothetical protein
MAGMAAHGKYSEKQMADALAADGGSVSHTTKTA